MKTDNLDPIVAGRIKINGASRKSSNLLLAARYRTDEQFAANTRQTATMNNIYVRVGGWVGRAGVVDSATTTTK